MHDLLKVFIDPGTVFSSMKDDIKGVQPLLALLLCVVVFTGAQPLFVSDQAFIEQKEESLDSGLGIFNRIGKALLGEEAMEELEREFSAKVEAEGTTFDELKEQAIADQTSPEQLQIMRIISAIFSPVGAVIWLGLGVLILATYFNLAGTSGETRQPWVNWLAFTLWSLMPVLVHYLLYLAATMVTGEVSPRRYLAPLAWLPGLQENAFAVNLTIGMIWAIWIQTVGLHRWLDRSIPVCLSIALVPWVIQWLIASGIAELTKAL